MAYSWDKLSENSQNDNKKYNDTQIKRYSWDVLATKEEQARIDAEKVLSQLQPRVTMPEMSAMDMLDKAFSNIPKTNETQSQSQEVEAQAEESPFLKALGKLASPETGSLGLIKNIGKLFTPMTEEENNQRIANQDWVTSNIEKGRRQANAGLAKAGEIATHYIGELAKESPVYNVLSGPLSNLESDFGEAANEIQKGSNLIDETKNQNLNFGQKLAGDVISSTANMADVFLPGIGQTKFFTQAAGSYANEAAQEGADINQQALYGAIGGAAEFALELPVIKGVQKLFGKSVSDEIVQTGTNNMLKELGKLSLDVGKIMGKEAFEEAAVDPITGLAKKAIYKPDMSWTGENGVVDWKQMGYDALVGALTGGALAAPSIPGNVMNIKATKDYIDQNYRPTLAVAFSMPEESDSYKTAKQFTERNSPPNYTELIDFQKQLMRDIANTYNENVPEGENKIDGDVLADEIDNDAANFEKAYIKTPNNNPEFFNISQDKINQYRSNSLLGNAITAIRDANFVKSVTDDMAKYGVISGQDADTYDVNKLFSMAKTSPTVNSIIAGKLGVPETDMSSLINDMEKYGVIGNAANTQNIANQASIVIPKSIEQPITNNENALANETNAISNEPVQPSQTQISEFTPEELNAIKRAGNNAETEYNATREKIGGLAGQNPRNEAERIAAQNIREQKIIDKANTVETASLDDVSKSAVDLQKIRKDFTQKAKGTGFKPSLADAFTYMDYARIKTDIRKGRITQDEVNGIIEYADKEGLLPKDQLDLGKQQLGYNNKKVESMVEKPNVSDSIISVSEKEFDGDDFQTQKKHALSYVKAHFQGKNFVNKDTGFSIGVSGDGIGETFNKGLSIPKIQSFKVLDKLLENSVLIDSKKDEKGRTNIKRWLYFSTKIKVGEVLYNVSIDVKETPVGNKYYLHRLNISKESVDTGRSDEETSPVHDLNTTDSKNNIPQKTENINKEDVKQKPTVQPKSEYEQQRNNWNKQADETKRLQDLGIQVTGVRLADAETTGKMYEMLQKGEITQKEWDNYVDDLIRSNKISDKSILGEDRIKRAAEVKKEPKQEQPPVEDKKEAKIEESKKEIKKEAKETNIKDLTPNELKLYNYLKGSKETTADAIIDKLEIPRGESKGFDGYQRSKLVRGLIEGLKGNEEFVSDKLKNAIHVEIPNDGTFDIANNEKAIAIVLSKLGVKLSLDVPKEVEKLFSKRNQGRKIEVGKDYYIFDGIMVVKTNADTVKAMQTYYGDDVALTGSTMENKFADLLRGELVEITGNPLIMKDDKKKGTSYYVFRDGDNNFAANTILVDYLNKNGNKFYYNQDKNLIIVKNVDDELTGIIALLSKGSFGENPNFADTERFMPSKLNFWSKPKKENSRGTQGFYAGDVEKLTGKVDMLPKGDNSSTESKTVDDIIKIIEDKIGVPIRTGKFKQKALGIFKVQPEVIRSKVRNDLPVISHELGHYFGKGHNFSDNKAFSSELLQLGQRTSKPSYTPKQVRMEGVAEFVRLYLTDPNKVYTQAPNFAAHFERTIDAGTIKILGEIRQEITKIVNLPANKKIYNDVSDYEARKSTKPSVNIFQKFYDAWINDKGPFKRVQDFAEEHGWTGKDIYKMVQNYSGFEAKALNMLYDKQRDLDGNVIGDSLMDILKPISRAEVKKRKGDALQERKDFISYMISRRAMDYKDRNLVMPEPWYVYEDNIQAMEKKYPHFVDLFDGIRKWEDNNLQLLVDAGIMKQGDIENIKLANANHVPLYRIREAIETVRPGSGNTLGQSKKVIKSARGSGATIIDPLESIIVDSFIIRRAAESNDILRALKNMSGKTDGIGQMIESVPPGSKKTSFTVEEIQRQLSKMAKDNNNDVLKDAVDTMTEDELESVLSIFRPLYMERDNEITIYDNGKPGLYQVEPELYKAIKGLNRQQSHFIIRLFNVPKRILQAGAVTTVDFMLRNMTRDTFTSSIQTEAGINPIDIFRGYISSIRKDKWFKEWVASGGGSEYLNINERSEAQKIEDELLGYGIGEKLSKLSDALKELKSNNNERTRAKAVNAFKQVIRMPFDTVRDLVQFSEAGPRVAEFRKAIEKGMDKETAAAWSRKLSQDFLRHGYSGKEVNKVIAFFNANVQGTVRLMETFKQHPIRTLIRGTMYITLPTLLLYFFNHDDEDYKQLPDYRKFLFWNIPIGGGRFIPIPKPYGYGWIFGALPEITMDKILKDSPDTWKQIKDSFAQNFNIPIIPSAVDPAIEVYSNKSWTGAPIETTGDKNLPAFLRQNENTSIISKAIGNIVQNEKGLSPKQIDYLVKGYTGKVGDFFWRLPDTIKKGIQMPTDITEYPVIKSFVVDAAYNSAAIDKLYNYGEELSTRKKALQETGKYKAMSHLPLDRQKQLFDALENARLEYNHIANSFTDARKAIKEIEQSDKYSPAVKKLKEKEIHIKMNKLADQFNDKYEKFKNQYNIK